MLRPKLRGECLPIDEGVILSLRRILRAADTHCHSNGTVHAGSFRAEALQDDAALGFGPNCANINRHALTPGSASFTLDQALCSVARVLP
jgi:hypothetical protein